MDAMADEYHHRTRQFARKLNGKMDFWLCRRPDDYRRLGGTPGSAGVYLGNRLVALADEGASRNLWHTIQHEGFHQFVHRVIGGPWPVWLNEGLVYEEGNRKPAADFCLKQVKLKQGCNKVLLKIVNKGGAHGFWFRMADKKGDSITTKPGISYSTSVK